MRKHFPTSKIRIISIITLYIQGNKLFECSSDIVRSGYPYRYGTCGLIDKTPNPGIAIGQKERRNNLTSRKKCTAIYVPRTPGLLSEGRIVSQGKIIEPQ